MKSTHCEIILELLVELQVWQTVPLQTKKSSQIHRASVAKEQLGSVVFKHMRILLDGTPFTSQHKLNNFALLRWSTAKNEQFITRDGVVYLVQTCNSIARKVRGKNLNSLHHLLLSLNAQKRLTCQP